MAAMETVDYIVCRLEPSFLLFSALSSVSLSLCYNEFLSKTYTHKTRVTCYITK